MKIDEFKQLPRRKLREEWRKYGNASDISRHYSVPIAVVNDTLRGRGNINIDVKPITVQDCIDINKDNFLHRRWV